MKREILCPFNLFSTKQIIYLCTEDQQTTVGTASLKNIASEMLKCGEYWDASTFHLIGNSLMAKKIAEDLKTRYALEYGIIDDIEVKVN